MVKRAFFLFIVFVVGIAATLRFAPAAKANILEDLWSRLAPLFRVQNEGVPQATSGDAASGSARSEVPLYKPVLDYERAVVAAVKKASPAVVSIVVSKNVPVIEDCPVAPFFNIPPEFQDLFNDHFQLFRRCEKGTRLEEVGGGSGFIISSDGLVLTNKHVVLDKKASYTVFTNDGKKYGAKVLDLDPTQDLAVMKVDSSTGLGAGRAGFPTVELGDSDSIELGQTAIAIGNALAEYRNTVSVGVISGLARNVTAGGSGGFFERISGVIQTDAAINPGNSGGPLLNLKGEVIGINTAIVSGAQNIGFAIPINRAKRAIASVKSTGEIQTAFLGVRYITVTPEVAKEQKLPIDYGALIRGNDDGPAVQPDSPAMKAGLRAEDIVLEVNGVKIDLDRPLGDVIAQYAVGETVTLKVNRSGKELELAVTLGKRPD
jgi:serine protease Do